MTVFTHGLFTTVLIIFFGITSRTAIGFFLLGSILPDIDHPQSAIGRIFFFISYPLNLKFGHRTFTHSFILWSVVCVVGLSYYMPIFWLGLGAFTHLFLDCWNLAGVRLFRPITEKIFVMASKKYRIRVGSKRELILSSVLIIMIVLGLKVNDMGGFRGMIKDLIGDYTTVIHDYEKMGLKVCTIIGKLRHNTGVIEDGEWLIIGKNGGTTSLSIYDKKTDRIIKIPQDAKFLKSRLRRETEYEVWNSLRFETPMKVRDGEAFYRAVNYWYKAKVGDVVAGDVLYRDRVVFGDP